ncbi:MAG: ribonuclease HII [Patescibacteria group bacterium]
MQTQLYAGIDEAGRGCVLGPMAIAIVAADEKDRRWFADIGVRDSKLLVPRIREDLAKRIRERCWHRIVIAQPLDIDAAVQSEGRSLNTLEQDLMSSLIRDFQTSFADTSARILSDAISRNTEKHAARLQELSHAIPHHIIIARIAADTHDKTVGAASILAKSERERLISLAREEIGYDFGSGYCSDPKTVQYLEECGREHAIVRQSWKIGAWGVGRSVR